MKRIKKLATIVLSAILMVSLFSGCNDSGSNEKKEITEVDVHMYESDGEFLRIADLPPNPNSISQIETYRDMGCNICILTEDSVQFTNDGVITEGYKQAIKNIGSTGLQVWIRNMYNDADYFQNEDGTKERSNYGTPYTIEERNITTELSEFDEITGYYMQDEAYMISSLHEGYAAFDQYDKLVEWHNNYAPNTFFHGNHVPGSSYDHWPSDYTYQMFLEYYANNVLSKVSDGAGRSICLDNYPFLEEDPEGIKESFLVDLLTGAIVTRDYNSSVDESKQAIFGMCVQTFKNTSAGQEIRTPTENEIKFQMNVGLALGTRLFEYFCYRSLPTFGLYGIIDTSGNITDLYYSVKNANDAVLPMSKVLMNFEWKNLILSEASTSDKIENEYSFRAAGELIKNNNPGDGNGVITSIVSQLDLIVGYYKNGDQDGYYFTNYSAPAKKLTNSVKAVFDGCTSAIVYHNGEVTQEKLFNGTLKLSLSEGDGAFVIPLK